MTIHRLAVLATLVIAAPACAFAHAQLRTAEPAVGGTVAAAPREVEITFSEAVEPRFSAIEVQDASGARVDTGSVHTAADNPKQLLVGLKPLPPGTFKVIWHATSTDTHKTEGTYSFTVHP